MKLDFLAITQFFQSPLLLLKIALIVIMALFVIFTVVVFTQVNVMNKIVTHTRASPLLTTIATLNIIFAVVLFLTALVIL